MSKSKKKQKQKNNYQKDKQEQNIEKVKFNDKEKFKMKIIAAISLLIGIIFELVFVKLANTFSTISIARLICVFGLSFFVIIHFVIDKAKIYNFIIKYRFKISIVMFLVSTIVGLLYNSNNPGAWFRSTSAFLSPWWNLKFYALFLASYELFRIITNEDKKLSAIGSILIVFSGCVQYNFEKIDALIFGELFIVFLYMMIKENKKFDKYSYALFCILCSACYVKTFIGFAVSFGYVFLALTIWIIIKSKLEYKKSYNVKFLVVTLVLSLIAAITIVIFVGNTYTDEVTGEHSISVLYSYLYNTELPFFNIENAALFGSFVSIFPTVLIFVFYYCFKYDEKIELLFPLLVVSVLEIIAINVELPTIISKIFLLNMTSIYSLSAAVSLVSVYMMMFIVSNISIRFKYNLYLTIVLTALIGIVGMPIAFNDTKYRMLCAMIFCLLTFSFFNIDDIRYKKVFIFFITFFGLISGIAVNPLIREVNNNSLYNVKTEVNVIDLTENN